MERGHRGAVAGGARRRAGACRDRDCSRQGAPGWFRAGHDGPVHGGRDDGGAEAARADAAARPSAARRSWRSASSSGSLRLTGDLARRHLRPGVAPRRPHRRCPARPARLPTRRFAVSRHSAVSRRYPTSRGHLRRRWHPWPRRWPHRRRSHRHVITRRRRRPLLPPPTAAVTLSPSGAQRSRSRQPQPQPRNRPRSRLAPSPCSRRSSSRGVD